MALMYQKPDFLWSKYSCADYVGLRLTSPSHSLSISLFLSYNLSLSQDVIVKRCKKKKREQMYLQCTTFLCSCNTSTALLVLVQHSFDVNKLLESDLNFSGYQKHIWLVKNCIFTCSLLKQKFFFVRNAYFLRFDSVSLIIVSIYNILYRHSIQKIFTYNICTLFNLWTRIVDII